MRTTIKTSVRHGAAWVCSIALALALCYLSAAPLLRPKEQAARVVPAHTGALQLQPLEVYRAGSVRVNTATAEELQALYGVGPVYAQAIVDEREAHGLFFFPQDLIAVKGIGEKRLEGFMEQLDLSLEADETN